MRPLKTFGGSDHNARERVEELRAEALARVRSYRERPRADRYPRYLLELDRAQRHVIVVDSNRSRVYLYENAGGALHLVADYYTTIGKRGIEKRKEGDQKTPIGVYYVIQFEFLERAQKRLGVVIPFTLAIIFVLLYLAFRRFDEAALIMLTLPFALIGGFWTPYLLGHNLSAVILGGLAPIMWSDGTGAEVKQRIAAPMIGGMITAPLLSMLVIPAAYLLLRRRPTNLKGTMK